MRHRLSVSDGEAAKLARGPLPIRSHVLNPGTGRPFFQTVQELFEHVARTFRNDANRTVGLIANPAVDPESPSLLSREITKSDALNPACDPRIDACEYFGHLLFWYPIKRLPS